MKPKSSITQFWSCLQIIDNLYNLIYVDTDNLILNGYHDDIQNWSKENKFNCENRIGWTCFAPIISLLVWKCLMFFLLLCNISSLVGKYFISGVEISRFWCGSISFLVWKYFVAGVEIYHFCYGNISLKEQTANLWASEHETKNSTIEQKSKRKNIFNAVVEIFSKQKGKYSFPEKKN